MRTIALLTDFGADSFYVGAMKAVLDAIGPGTPQVDVMHSVQRHAVAQAGFVLDRVYEWFAPGTVFLVVVDPGVGTHRRNVIVEAGGRLIVCPDNGVAGEVAARYRGACYYAIDDDAVDRLRHHRPVGRTFLGRDVFAPVAASLAAGAEPAGLGRATERIETLAGLPLVEAGRGRVRGAGRFVDSFGNILSNVSAAHVAAAFGDRPQGGVVVSAGGRDIGGLHDFYAAQPPGRLVAVLGSWGLVEVAVNQGSAIDEFEDVAPESLAIELRRGR